MVFSASRTVCGTSSVGSSTVLARIAIRSLSWASQSIEFSAKATPPLKKFWPGCGAGRNSSRIK
jgi:hypothetical protein